jgi:hypothetical protein
MRMFFAKDELLFIENLAISKFEYALSFAGFSPSNTFVFPLIIKAGWLLLICEFSLVQLAWFATAYLLSFPLLVIFLALFGKKIRSAIKENQPKASLIEPKHRSFSFSNATVALLTGWLILYGGSSNQLPQIAGILLAASLLGGRVLAALSFAGPIEAVKLKWAEAFIQMFNEILKKGGVSSFRRFEDFLYRLLLRGAWITRGSKGRNRAAMLVLLRYLLNLFALGFANILFWALLIRFSTHPFIGLQEALMISGTRVLPGFTVSADLKMPLWVSVGSSISAWVLFVVYAGPAASIFPLMQQAYVDAISSAHIKLRKTAMAFLSHVRSSTGGPHEIQPLS